MQGKPGEHGGRKHVTKQGWGERVTGRGPGKQQYSRRKDPSNRSAKTPGNCLPCDPEVIHLLVPGFRTSREKCCCSPALLSQETDLLRAVFISLYVLKDRRAYQDKSGFCTHGLLLSYTCRLCPLVLLATVSLLISTFLIKVEPLNCSLRAMTSCHSLNLALSWVW